MPFIQDDILDAPAACQEEDWSTGPRESCSLDTAMPGSVVAKGHSHDGHVLIAQIRNEHVAGSVGDDQIQLGGGHGQG